MVLLTLKRKSESLLKERYSKANRNWNIKDQDFAYSCFDRRCL